MVGHPIHITADAKKYAGTFTANRKKYAGTFTVEPKTPDGLALAGCGSAGNAALRDRSALQVVTLPLTGVAQE
jgi:hypothetical protein